MLPFPRIVFCDLDGSFLARDKSVPTNNQALLTTLDDLDIYFVPSTGRPLAALPEFLKDHSCVRYAITSSGTLVSDVVTGEPLHNIAIGHERARALYSQLKELPIAFDLFTDKGVVCEKWRYDLLPTLGIDKEQLGLMLSTRKIFDGSFEDMLACAERIDRVGIFHAANDEGAKHRALIRAVIEADPTLSWAAGHPLSLEVTDIAADKGQAMLWLCDFLGIDVSHAWAFGDSGNDIAMLKAAGVGAALRNATNEVKRAAKFVCEGDCDEGGVAQELTKVLGMSNT